MAPVHPSDNLLSIRTMILIQISDTHLSLDVEQGCQRSADLRRTVAAINALVPQPSAVIHTGDLANRGKPGEYAEARRLLEPLRAPLYVVPGNRDDRDALRSLFVKQPCLHPHPSFVQFSVEDHPVRLLGLDSQSTRSQKGSYCDARHAALVQALARETDKPTAVFVHHPPFDISGVEDSFQYESRAEVERLVETLTRAGQIERIFCGHAHRARRVELNGVRASTIPSLAVDLRKGDDRERPSSLPRFQIHHYTEGPGFATTEVEVAA
jgi:3',5'-cyclic AMP phosphodiesterase CpdA